MTGVHAATGASAPGDRLPPPLATHRAGEAALLAEYPDTAAVLAAAAAVRALQLPHLVDLVPAERTLLLAGTAPRDLQDLADLLRHLPAPAAEQSDADEQTLAVTYDGEDLAETAELLGMSTDALIRAHTGAVWTVAFGGFAPGFPYLVAGDDLRGIDRSRPDDGSAEDGSGPERAKNGHDGNGHAADPDAPPWDVPRRAEPRTAVPAGAVGLASRYCGIYPRSSPGGWQLIGRTEAELFDVTRTPPALLTPGTRVRFTAQRPSARPAGSSSAATRTRRGAGTVSERRARRRGQATVSTTRTTAALEVLSRGPLLLLQDGGRPGQGAIGVSPSGAADRGALVRADLAVGNPAHAAVLEALAGPLRVRALAPTIVAVAGAEAALTVHRSDPEGADIDVPAGRDRDVPIALDPGDELELGPVTHGLRLVLAVRGGIQGVRRRERADGTCDSPGSERTDHPDSTHDSSDAPVLGSLSRDTLSGLGPAPLEAGDVLLVGATHGFDAVPATYAPVIDEEAGGGRPEDRGPDDGGDEAEEQNRTSADRASTGDVPSGPGPLEVPLHAGPRDELLGRAAMEALLGTDWTVRSDSDRIGVRLDGPALPVPEGAGSLPSEAMVPGAIQVPPSGLPVVFGPDHPTTGGYPVLGVVPRLGLDRLAQAAPGQTVRFQQIDDAVG
ncbi:MAG: urea amidolyase family protein [Brachybacterium sp.]|uniref:5-oxoprolinase subunit B/C family protein n=1 Tax=Brachybacterium sp. TaxID=1891286 RepID=UPI002649EB28|nr:carboxyltransferase domain-containing protein [Brachybacterium sp.]MDN5685796.1 urea amidolyase family protein [Brachybacterium sp.]